jgi:hypothetical protein
MISGFESIARWLVVLGLILIVIGAGIYLAGRIGLPIGRLPGDIRIERGNLTCVIPLATSLLLSLLLTLVVNLLARLLGR